MEIKDLEARIKELENKVSTMQDIEEINRLQRSYGYYLEHWMSEEVIDCFSDSPETELNIMVGTYLGKEGVQRYFRGDKDRCVNPEFLHLIMPLSGVVDIAPDGKTAEGRWYGFGAGAIPVGKGVLQTLTGGIYACKYIKEGGKWKILKITWNMAFNAPPGTGWVKPERVAAAIGEKPAPQPRADKAREINPVYPSGYIVPFHYPHPVTGRETSEKKHNADLKKEK